MAPREGTRSLRLLRHITATLSALGLLIALIVLAGRVSEIGDRLPILLVIGLGLLIVALVVDAARIRRRAFEFSAFAPLGPEDVLDEADEWFEGHGWELRDTPDDRVIVRREQSVNVASLAILLVAGVVPGLVYLALIRRAPAIEITVRSSPAEGGSTVDLTGTGLSGEALAFFRGLQVTAGRRRVEAERARIADEAG